MREKVTLDKIFSLQEQLLERNKKEFLKRYEFIKDCLELVLNVQTDRVAIERLGKKDICKIFNTFYFTGRSSLISALKLLLYGVPGDSMACLRISWESFVCIDYANEFDAFGELKCDVLLKKEKVKYEGYAQKLKQKDNAHRLRVWGELDPTPFLSRL